MTCPEARFVRHLSTYNVNYVCIIYVTSMSIIHTNTNPYTLVELDDVCCLRYYMQI